MLKEDIKDLISKYKTLKEEVWEQANELSKVDKSKLNDEDREIIIDLSLLLETENRMYGIFINDLLDIVWS